jgi:3D (Asp-Asp-Asp) domain-containing protein
LVTASGFKINPKNPKRHRIIAVSRDLKKKYKFGTRVKISGAGKYSGEYRVRDVMNKRYKKRIDILRVENGKSSTKKSTKK